MITDQMSDALHSLEQRWRGKRRPKAFYLGPDEYAAFMATDPPTIETVWGNNPPKDRIEPSFRNLPVREAKGLECRLYDHCSYGHPFGAKRDPEAMSDIPVDKVFDALDRISRTRALTNKESLALEAAMKGKVVLTKRDAARLGIKRHGY